MQGGASYRDVPIQTTSIPLLPTAPVDHPVGQCERKVQAVVADDPDESPP